MSWISKGISHLTSLGKGLWEDFTGQTAWKQQAEYNTPANQVARYREAGLNPNLIYGSGSASAGNMSSPPPSDGAGINMAINGVLSLVQAAKGITEIKKDKSDIDLSRLSTLSAIEHSKDVLELEKQKQLLDSAFRTNEFDWKVSNSNRDFNLRKAAQDFAVSKFDYEKNNIDKWGSKPGSSVDFLSKLIGHTMGKTPFEVASDTNSHLNNFFSWIFGNNKDIATSHQKSYRDKLSFDTMIKHAKENPNDSIGLFRMLSELM